MSNSYIYLPATSIKPTDVDLPGSKSISNRTLLLAALSDNDTEIYSLLESDDTKHMLEALNNLGVSIHNISSDHNKQQYLKIKGCAGSFPNKKADLFLGNAGTAFRPLTAALAVSDGHYYLHGVPRMHERPIGDLVDALTQIGAQINYEGEIGFPPLFIRPFTHNGQHTISVNGNVSSQFLTALLLALPLTKKSYIINVQGELISQPYIDITLKLMSQFGIQIKHDQFARFYIPADATYHSPTTIQIEGDASSASYFFAAGFITGVPIRVHGLNQQSIQGDIAFVTELEKIGATVHWGENYIEVSRAKSQPIQPFDLDANHIPDAAMTLAIIALACKQTCHLRNIASWRVKETDRLSAMTAELRKLGAQIEEKTDSFSITSPTQLKSDVHIKTYDDHRMAMCFALVSLMNTPIYIDDPECVNKTFPDYFQVLASLSRK